MILHNRQDVFLRYIRFFVYIQVNENVGLI